MKLFSLPFAAALVSVTWACSSDTNTTASSGASVQAELVRHTVTSDGHPIAVWEKSAPDAEAVIVLLHGRTWSALPDFDLQVPGENLSLMDGLVAAGYSTFGPDMRGYGSTPRDATGWLTPDRAARDLAAVLQWVWEKSGGGERPVLLGWSLGSMISQLTVQRHPELVSQLVLFGYPFDPTVEISRQDHPDKPPRLRNTAKAAASDFITPGSISQTAIGSYVAAALAADSIRVDWNDWESWAELKAEALTVPTLLLQGQFDPLAKSEGQVALFTGLGTPDKEWIVIPGGDHAAFLETPRPHFIAALVSFIERHR
ncbi:MAG: alpha/beta hydrolase [Gemmatimonadales bacterium]